MSKTTVLLDERFTDPALPGWRVIEGHQLAAEPGIPAGPWNFGTGEIQRYDRSGLSTGPEGLKITPSNKTGEWVSARIEREQFFKPAKGESLAIAGRITLPNLPREKRQGLWAAFWTLGAPYREMHWIWPGCGEWDILEAIGKEEKTFHTAHVGSWTKNTGSENLLTDGTKYYSPDGIGKSYNLNPWDGQPHDYMLLWDRTSGDAGTMIWFVDGAVVHALSLDLLRRQAKWAATSHDGIYPILNYAVGGDWPGGPDGQTASDEPMIVEYVQVLLEQPDVPVANDPEPPTEPQEPAQPPVEEPQDPSVPEPEPTPPPPAEEPTPLPEPVPTPEPPAPPADPHTTIDWPDQPTPLEEAVRGVKRLVVQVKTLWANV